MELARGVVARCLITDISDRFIKDFKTSFPSGKLVEARVTSIDKEKNLVSITLKKSAVVGKSGEGQFTFDKLEIGMVVAGEIKKVESFGLFVFLARSRLQGLCHISQVSDKKVNDLASYYKPGDYIKAKVLRLDSEKKRISLGVKASLFNDPNEVIANMIDVEEEAEEAPEAEMPPMADEEPAEMEGEAADVEMDEQDLADVADALSVLQDKFAPLLDQAEEAEEAEEMPEEEPEIEEEPETEEESKTEGKESSPAETGRESSD